MRIEKNFIDDIKNIVNSARNRTYAAINFYMVETYWKIGERIVMEEQKGEKKAEYGTFLLKELSKRLTADLGKGFNETNLRDFRYFYITFSQPSIQRAVRAELQNTEDQKDEKSRAVRGFLPDDEKTPKRISSAARSTLETQAKFETLPLRRELTWTHYRLIMRVDNPSARNYYMTEAADHNWSTRVLERNINTLYYERILSTHNKSEALAKAGLLEKQSPADFIKDPYIFEVRRGTLLYILGSTEGIFKRKYPSQPVYLDSKGKGESSILVKRWLEMKCPNQRVARLIGQGEGYTA